MEEQLHLPQQVVPLDKDVDSMAQGYAVQVMCINRC